jgi:hypothetical protein
MSLITDTRPEAGLAARWGSGRRNSQMAIVPPELIDA